ncbi:hypothetical protein AX769_00610 [Frondihabitans sp. PAMC 28766]|uniref:ROK family protein n=1 Tax=Frondihabitans sp. PAMC 28766 TaxID=1795630 RepID=UPI00078DEB7F|nr:ROK family protein [Frondihabitans sp. PAMC 28766]AMM18913.1 hypothetical protein AX769_00610 [Frondihabitans sp. PAMC 28766]
MTTPRYGDQAFSPGSPGDVLRLIRSGAATSRAELVRVTGLAPSTVSLRVEGLFELGLLREIGAAGSTGGRRARRLEIDPSAGVVAAIDLGAHHVRIAVRDLAGRAVADDDASGEILVSADPAETVDAIWAVLERLRESRGDGRARPELRGIAVSVPAPVEYPSGRIRTPSFQPAWDGADLPSLFAHHTDAPVLIENDGNLIALAERPTGARSGSGAGAGAGAGAGSGSGSGSGFGSAAGDAGSVPAELVAIKIGTRIGAGVISGGRLHRGASGAAGEFSHSTVDGTPAVGCTCGIPACLESVASGRAIAARLQALGHDVETPAQIVELAAHGDPDVVAVLRESGVHIGRSLAGIVNFINPRTVVVAGALAGAPHLVAAIRGELYSRCLPLVAESLEVRVSTSPTESSVRGAVDLVLDEVFAPPRIDARFRQG